MGYGDGDGDGHLHAAMFFLIPTSQHAPVCWCCVLLLCAAVVFMELWPYDETSAALNDKVASLDCKGTYNGPGTYNWLRPLMQCAATLGCCWGSLSVCAAAVVWCCWLCVATLMCACCSYIYKEHACMHACSYIYIYKEQACCACCCSVLLLLCVSETSTYICSRIGSYWLILAHTGS